MQILARLSAEDIAAACMRELVRLGYQSGEGELSVSQEGGKCEVCFLAPVSLPGQVGDAYLRSLVPGQLPVDRVTEAAAMVKLNGKG